MTKAELKALNLQKGDVVQFMYKHNGTKKLGTGDFMCITKSGLRNVVRVSCIETITYFDGYQMKNNNLVFDIKLKNVLGKKV